MPERTFDDFDQFARDYRTIHSRNVMISGADSFYFSEMKILLLKQFEKNADLKLLDIGCGDGATELFIQKHFPSWNVTGIDISQKSIEIAAERNLGRTVFSLFDGINIPFEDQSMDVVFMAGVLHHVAFDRHANIIGEIWRVLKKGGRFYLFEHNPFNPLTRYLVNTCVFDQDAKLLKSSYSSRLISQLGLKIKEKQFIIFFPRKGILSRLIFLEKYLRLIPLGGQYLIYSMK